MCAHEWAGDEMPAMQHNEEEPKKIKRGDILLKGSSAFDSLMPNLLLKWIDAIKLCAATVSTHSIKFDWQMREHKKNWGKRRVDKVHGD